MTASSAAYISNVYGHQMVSCKLVSLVSQPAILRVSLCEVHTDWLSAQNQLTASLIIFGPSSTFQHSPHHLASVASSLTCLGTIFFFFFFFPLSLYVYPFLFRHKRSNSGLLCLSFLYFSSPTQGHLPEAKICLRTCELIMHKASERAYICPAALMYGYLWKLCAEWMSLCRMRSRVGVALICLCLLVKSHCFVLCSDHWH